LGLTPGGPFDKRGARLKFSEGKKKKKTFRGRGKNPGNFAGGVQFFFSKPGWGGGGRVCENFAADLGPGLNLGAGGGAPPQKPGGFFFLRIFHGGGPRGPPRRDFKRPPPRPGFPFGAKKAPRPPGGGGPPTPPGGQKIFRGGIFVRGGKTPKGLMFSGALGPPGPGAGGGGPPKPGRAPINRPVWAKNQRGPWGGPPVFSFFGGARQRLGPKNFKKTPPGQGGGLNRVVFSPQPPPKGFFIQGKRALFPKNPRLFRSGAWGGKGPFGF